MYYNKNSIILYIIILFTGIISVTIASECDILAKAFEHLKGDFLQNFLLYSNCCNYYPVITCSGGLVTEINLNNYVNSEADFESAIGTLTGLKSLTSLKITGTSSAHGVVIPESISKLKYLKILKLSDNQSEDTGYSIPDVIGNLKNLEELNLSNNNLVGAIPKSIKNLKKLNKLNLSKNNLSGTIPYEITELDNLKEMNLNDNKELNGYVPLNSNIEYCNYSNTNLCRLEDITCKTNIPKCTKEDISNTNKENGAPNDSTYENKKPSSFDFKKVLGIIGIIFIIMLIIIGYCSYKHCSSTYFEPIQININNTNTNYNPNHASKTTINNNIYNYNLSSSTENPPPYSSISETNNSYYRNPQVNYTSNSIPTQPPFIPSAAYTPSAPEKY